MDLAAQYGRLDVVQFLHERGRDCTIEAMSMAAGYGHRDVVWFLHENRGEGTGGWMIPLLARKGYLELMEFFLENRPEECGGEQTNLIDYVAPRGHLHVVRYLHEMRGHWHQRRFRGYSECTTGAMDGAAQNGHLDVVIYLHQNRTEGCTEMAMNYAAEHGHLEIVKWLYENRTEGYIAEAKYIARFWQNYDLLGYLEEVEPLIFERQPTSWNKQ